MAEIIRDGVTIKLTDEECYKIFFGVLSGLSASVVQTYIQNLYGDAHCFDKNIFDSIGAEVAVAFLDELRDGEFIPGGNTPAMQMVGPSGELSETEVGNE